MHFEPTPFAYQGFRPWSDIVPPVLKPGETLQSRANKFSEVGHGVVYKRAASNELRHDETNTAASLECVEPEDFKVPDKRGVSASWASEATNKSRQKKFIATTTYRAGYCAPESTLIKAGEPEWLKASKKPTANSVRIEGNKSSYQLDFGTAGDSPSKRPFMTRGGMATTTMDLSEGTSKVTHHIPGYSGTIPINRRNPDIVKHSSAVEHRKPVSDLRLYHKHNMPGYTGHKPTHASNDRGESLAGANTATTSGAAATGMML